MSHNVNLQHIVFRTKHSEPTIPEAHKRELLAYITHISQQFQVKLLRINAYRNHVHMLIDIKATENLASFIKAVKADSSRVFQRQASFPTFRGWARNYGSFSISRWDKDRIINYIRGQEEHHRYHTFNEELAEIFGMDATNDKWWRKDWLDEEPAEDENPS